MGKAQHEGGKTGPPAVLGLLPCVWLFPDLVVRIDRESGVEERFRPSWHPCLDGLALVSKSVSYLYLQQLRTYAPLVPYAVSAMGIN
jgi:hypothetical protein